MWCGKWEGRQINSELFVKPKLQISYLLIIFILLARIYQVQNSKPQMTKLFSVSWGSSSHISAKCVSFAAWGHECLSVWVGVRAWVRTRSDRMTLKKLNWEPRVVVVVFQWIFAEEWKQWEEMDQTHPSPSSSSSSTLHVSDPYDQLL